MTRWLKWSVRVEIDGRGLYFGPGWVSGVYLRAIEEQHPDALEDKP